MPTNEIFAGIKDARLNRLNEVIEKILARGAKAPGDDLRLRRAMKVRDSLIAAESAKRGAEMASAYTRGGGLASSGIRGMDIIEHEFTPEVIRANNIDANDQGARQFSVAPPGSGRLNPVNFYTSAGVGPLHVVTSLSTGGGIGTGLALQTQSINWAIVRVVALTTQVTVLTGTTTTCLLEDFKIGGGANLFLTEGYVIADDYDTDKEQFVGLRAYPVLQAPNVAFVTAYAYHATSASQTAQIAVSCVTEVLRDDAFGPGLPASYAR